MAQRKRPAPTAPVISACLIVKDEERNLRRCLGSLDGKVDQLIVLDTGSTDRTVEIAREHGADVFHFPWRDDFSAARNESLSHATGDYVIWIDADDELIEQTPGALRRLCSDDTAAWGYFVDVECPSEDPTRVPGIVRQWRLFPAKLGIRFEGRIHEHPVAPSIIRPEDLQLQDEVRIVHWGYTEGGEVQRRRLARNRKLIEQCIQDDPRQPRHYFNLGAQLSAQEQPAQALKVLQEGIDRWFQAHGADIGYVPAMFATAAGAALNLGQPETVLRIEQRTPAEFVSSDLLLYAGLACRDLGRLPEAAARWTRAISDQQAIRNILSDRGCVERARMELATLEAHSPKPVLTACLIVKNEEVDLPRCLASIKECVDEIVVVDTGSTDRTVEIAQSFGARTSFFEWCDDFSAARNFSLQQARGDFILWVDADDELLPTGPDALRQLCRELPDMSWAYWVDVHCPTDKWHEGETIVKQPRLFRNGPGLAFAGRLHEQLGAPTGFTPEELTFQDGFSVKHWGYVPQEGTSSRRSDRNHRILELEIDQNPNEHFHYYKLGLQHAGDKEFAEGLAMFERAFELWQRDPEARGGHVASMLSMATLCAVETKQFDKALQIEVATPAGFVSTDLLYHAGLAWWSLGNESEAIARFQRAIDDGSVREHNAHDRSTSTWRPLIMLAAVYAEQGEFQQAYEAARQALEFAPTRPDGLYLKARSAYSLGHTEEAVALCRQALATERDDGFKPKIRRLLLNAANELDDDALALEALEDGEVEGLSPAGALYLRARLCEREGDIQGQQQLLLEGCSQFPEDAEIRIALSQAMEAHGLEAQAIDLLGAAIDYPPVPAAIYQRLAVLLARKGMLEDAANALELAKRAMADAPDEALAPA